MFEVNFLLRNYSEELEKDKLMSDYNGSTLSFMPLAKFPITKTSRVKTGAPGILMCIKPKYRKFKANLRVLVITPKSLCLKGFLLTVPWLDNGIPVWCGAK